MTRALLILPILALAGCAGPAKAQPEPQDFKRVEEAVTGNTGHIDALGALITDQRFDSVNALITKTSDDDRKSEDDRHTANMASLKAISDELKELRSQLLTLTIIISSVATTGVVGGGVYKFSSMGKKETVGSEA